MVALGTWLRLWLWVALLRVWILVLPALVLRLWRLLRIWLSVQQHVRWLFRRLWLVLRLSGLWLGWHGRIRWHGWLRRRFVVANSARHEWRPEQWELVDVP